MRPFSEWYLNYNVSTFVLSRRRFLQHPDGKAGGIVQHFCMVYFYAGALLANARFHVDAGAAYSVVAVNAFSFTGKIFILRMHMVFVRERMFRAKLAAQINLICMNQDLERLFRRVIKTVIEIVVQDRGPRSEWDRPPEIRKKIISVMMVVFRDDERRMQHHPMKQIRKLTHPAAHAAGCFSFADCQAR